MVFREWRKELLNLRDIEQGWDNEIGLRTERYRLKTSPVTVRDGPYVMTASLANRVLQGAWASTTWQKNTVTGQSNGALSFNNPLRLNSIV